MLGFFLTSAQVRDDVVALLRDTFPGVLDREFVNEVLNARAASLGIGLLGTLWSVTAIYATLDRALSAVLDQRAPRSLVRGRLRGLAFAAVLVLLAALSFVLSFVVQALSDTLLAAGVAPTPRIALEILSPLVGLASGFALFAVIYHQVPQRRQSRRALLAGAGFAALLWEVAKIAFAVLVREAALFTAYGALALAAGLLTWIYLTAIILLAGAELMKAMEARPA